MRFSTIQTFTKIIIVTNIIRGNTVYNIEALVNEVKSGHYSKTDEGQEKRLKNVKAPSEKIWPFCDFLACNAQQCINVETNVCSTHPTTTHCSG